jgi:thiol-disulfide isomerase/thioredoxin
MPAPLQGTARRLALVSAVGGAVLLAIFALARYGPLAPSRLPVSALPVVGPTPAHLTFTVIDPPRRLPPIRFADAGGRQLSLRDFQDRVVLLDLWATWCAPCRNEMPALDRLQGELGGHGFAVVPVSIDGTGINAVEPFYRELGIERLGIYLDPLGRGTSGLDVPGLPTTLLVDRDGRLVARQEGGARWDSPEMVARIRRYLPPAAAPLRGGDGK